MAGWPAAAAAMSGSGRPALSRLSLLLGVLSTVGPYSIDAFFPSLRAIGAEFHVSNWQAQQLLTAFMVAYAFMSLVHGSLSDALGRRRVILTGMVVYTLASLGCTLAPNFPALLAFRFVQGVTAGSGQIVGRAIVRDRYSGAEAQRLMSAIVMIFGLGPALAPIIGGWVHVLLGWRAVFGTMALFGGVLALISWRTLPETHPPEKRTALQVRSLVRHNLGVLRNREFVLLALGTGACFMGMQAYMASAPAIILDHWGMTETQFAALMLPIISGYTLSAYLSGRLAGRMAPDRQVRLGLAVLETTAAGMLLLQYFLPAPPVYAQQLLLTGIAVGLQLMYPVISLRILDMFPHARGAASSMQAFFSLLLAGTTMGALAPALSRTMLRLATVSFCAIGSGWLLWLAAQRYRVARQAVQEA
jgi:DHA1 family bicyclomycin/chloramphenicol resistance-like MFS transporter